MHQPIRERLEEYLGGMEDPVGRREIENHLAACSQCRQVVDAMRRQSEFIHGLRPADDVEPSPGFYARVLDRIESQRVPSIWELFLEPVFGRRLAYASLTLLLILGTLVVTGGRQVAGPAYHYYSPDAILAAEPVSQYMGDDLEHDRGVVFVNLATYEY